MSEDRLEKALEAIKMEEAGAEEVARARNRVWDRLNQPGDALCAEFQQQFPDYVDSRLEGSRRLLLEDHLGRCPSCRAELAAQRGNTKVARLPERRKAQWPRWGTWVAAAALLCAAIYLGRSSIDSWLAGGPGATVVSVKGSLYLVPQGALKPGLTVDRDAVVRTGPNSRAVLRLADGSLVDVNERTELYVHSAWTGKVVNLRRGDIIVQAAKQRRGYLRVQTRDSLASVKGTVFAVSTGLNGSLISVIEGSVSVAQLGTEVVLSPGEQSASNPALATSVQQAVSWSPDAETYIGMLASLAQIQKEMAGMAPPLLRMHSVLLQFMPPNMVVYGAIPNLGGTISQAMDLAEREAAANPAFGQFWNSGAGRNLKLLTGRIQTIAPLLGNEIVYGYSPMGPGTAAMIPVILAEVLPGKQNELAAALGALGILPDQSFNLTDSLLVLSDSRDHLLWLKAHLGEGAASPFAAEIAARYADGASWLFGIDMDSILALQGTAPEFVRAQQLKHVFLEQRASGAEENEIAVSFKGPRTGLVSFLSNTGSGGAAEYLSSDTLAAVYVSTREPRQMFEELTGLISRSEPQFQENLAKAEAALGVRFADDFAAAVGTEAALSLDGFSLTGPAWTLAVLVNDPSALEGFIRRMAEGCNIEFERNGEAQRITIAQEAADGRTWTTMEFSQPPLSLTWTYDNGYLVAASDRGTALRAVAIRNGGLPLVWSPAFQQQLPGSIGLHPSGFAWLNTKGTLQGLASLFPNAALQKLAGERDPVLVALSAGMEQIRAVSRTRISGLIMDLLLMQGFGRSQTGPPPATP